MDLVYLRHTNSHQTELNELLPYKVLFYPHPTILTESTAKLLNAYVNAGGTLVFGARTGYKDEYGRCPMMPMPGHAAPLCGVEVTDYTFVRPEEAPAQIHWEGALIPAPIFHDILAPLEGGQVLATFAGGYYDGKPALVRKSYPGGGAAYYVGSGFSREMAELFLKKLNVLSPYAEEVECPQAVELAVREKDGKQFLFLLNFSGETQALSVKGVWGDALSSELIAGAYSLPPYGVLILER